VKFRVLRDPNKYFWGFITSDNATHIEVLTAAAAQFGSFQLNGSRLYYFPCSWDVAVRTFTHDNLLKAAYGDPNDWQPMWTALMHLYAPGQLTDDNYSLFAVSGLDKSPVSARAQPLPVRELAHLNLAPCSEQSITQSLQARDNKACVLCGTSGQMLYGAHIVDDSCKILLQRHDGTAIVDPSSDKNKICLCGGCHAAFDDFAWTLFFFKQNVYESVVGWGNNQDRHAKAISCAGQKITVSQGTENSPLPMLFTLKQLGRFRLKCTYKNTCEKNYPPKHFKSLGNHLHIDHDVKHPDVYIREHIVSILDCNAVHAVVNDSGLRIQDAESLHDLLMSKELAYLFFNGAATSEFVVKADDKEEKQ